MDHHHLGPGSPADRAPITQGTESATALATFLTSLHQPAPDQAPTGRHRGGPLDDYSDGFTKFLTEATTLGAITDPDAARAREVWEESTAAPNWDGPPLWIHADLHPANILTTAGTLSGVIDFGDLCAGDPACDLAAPWILLPANAYTHFHSTYLPTPNAATLHRARGYALLRALAGILIGEAGLRGRPGGKPTWGPPAHTALQRLITTTSH